MCVLLKLIRTFILFCSFLPFVSSWAGPFDNLAEKTFRKLDNSLTLQVIPSTYPLVWEKPWEIIFSVLKNKYYYPKTSSSLGHVTGEINCTINNERQRMFIGQTTKDLLGFSKKLREGYGFSILNHPRLFPEVPFVTIDGALDSKDKSYERFDRLIRKNHFGAISFALDEQSCKYALDFAREYEEKTKTSDKAGNRYGFGADAFKFEGAGCATMAEALLLKAGLEKYAKMYERTVYVSPKLVGDPKNNKRVGFWDIFKENHNMKNFKQGYLKFVFPDPQLMYDHLEGLENTLDKKVEVYQFTDSLSRLVVVKP